MLPFRLMAGLLAFLPLRRKTHLIKIRAAKAYVAGVRKARLAFLSTVLVLFALVLLGSALGLAHTAILTCSPWSPQVKFTVALILASAEMLAAVAVLLYLFREEIWTRFTGISAMVDSIVRKKTLRE